MIREKQIDEMAKAICEHYVKGGCGRCPDCACEGDALKLYNAGYRRQREGEWILQQNGKGVCSKCNRQDNMDELACFCRYCGARMKGGA